MYSGLSEPIRKHCIKLCLNALDLPRLIGSCNLDFFGVLLLILLQKHDQALFILTIKELSEKRTNGKHPFKSLKAQLYLYKCFCKCHPTQSIFPFSHLQPLFLIDISAFLIAGVLDSSSQTCYKGSVTLV